MYYFPLTLRLQLLYASEATAESMRWHNEHFVEDVEYIKCTNYTIDETDYYSQLQEVVKLEYLGWPIKRTNLFKYE